MKKCLLIALACAALASCAKDEANAPNVNQTSDAKITFEAPVIAPTTRALYGKGATYKETDRFSVSATYTATDDYTAWATATPNLYMNEVEVGYNTTDKGWDGAHGTGQKDYYWPKQGSLTFQAFSPSSIAGITEIGATGVKITNYTIAPTVGANVVDVMYSERAYNKKKDNVTTVGSYSGIQIEFKHALTSIKFTAQRAEAYTGTDIKITDITISGTKTTGSFDQDITDGNDAKTPTDLYYWTTSGNAVDIEVLKSATADVANTAATPVAGVDFVVAMPQEFANDSKITVGYTINGVAQTAEVNLGNLTYTGTEAGTKGFEIGKEYTFNIKIALDKIYFAPSVTNWTGVTITDINNNN